MTFDCFYSHSRELCKRRYVICSSVALYVFVCLFCNAHLKFKSFDQSSYQHQDVTGGFSSFVNIYIEAHGIRCVVCRLKIGALRNRKRSGRSAQIFQFRIMRIEPKDINVVCDPHSSYETSHTHKSFSIYIENSVTDEYVVPRYLSVRNDVVMSAVCPYANVVAVSLHEKNSAGIDNDNVTVSPPEENSAGIESLAKYECASVASFIRVFLKKLEDEPHTSNAMFSMESIQRALVDAHFIHVVTIHDVPSGQEVNDIFISNLLLICELMVFSF